MYASKPVIGITGGIASGKSTVARALGTLGCLVIDSDELVRQAYRHEPIRRRVAETFGEGVLTADGVDRRALARAIFGNPEARRRLEGIVHPLVETLRLEQMAAAAKDPGVRAFVLDTPLLMETGLDAQCDAVVFVQTPLQVRAARAVARGWDEPELDRREKVQMPLDKKRKRADYSVAGTLAEVQMRAECQRVLADVLSRTTATSSHHIGRSPLPPSSQE